MGDAGPPNALISKHDQIYALDLCIRPIPSLEGRSIPNANSNADIIPVLHRDP